ncbi:hypothetical protein E308F_17990 [Moorella sp. E308F]|uniref:hypothetical protein n=1 Tax=unclassified Neomoorella TaxID=2676739 RepID=UPI0010FFC317|nr:MULTISPECIES: hypothetical protein [unclassified Moorella (in: firmicutes)]GEA15555.1 hypothetical protein E308F_17990 [Moorella sp. E308F]GEA19587.1 hypothetical protein E306M_27250 [Moorella sp. E306M]
MGILLDLIHGNLDDKKVERYKKKFNSRAYIYGDLKYNPPEEKDKKAKKRRLIKPDSYDAVNVFRSVVVDNIKYIGGLVGNENLSWVKGKLIVEDGVRYVAIPTSIVRKAFKDKGFDYAGGVERLKEKGALLTTGRGSRNAVRLRLNGTLEWCLAVKAETVNIPIPQKD